MTTSSESHAPADAHGHAHAHGGDVQIDHTLHTHVCSAGAFGKVFAALLVLTVVTVAVSRVDFGPLNMFVAMAIAACKASLVMAVFMHLRWDTPINNIAFLGSLVFLALLFLFTIADCATRGDVDRTMTQPAAVDRPFEWHQDH